MSRLAALQARMRSLRDIADILSAMKNLAQAEIAKLSRFCDTQQDMFRTVREAFADFQQFYGDDYAASPSSPDSLLVLIGSERGFCGGFNNLIEQTLKAQAAPAENTRLIVVGRRLAQRFLGDQRVTAVLHGASSAEEIPKVISQLAAELARYPTPRWKIICNSYESSASSPRVVSFFDASAHPEPSRSRPFEFPPLLNIPPADARRQLVEQYLLAMFYGVFYLSLMAENQDRLRHMDGALNRLEDELQRMRNRSNALRQETITEELELILLNVADPAQPDESGGSRPAPPPHAEKQP
jgi:F-type H+-transporting ATPase subunit gamma